MSETKNLRLFKHNEPLETNENKFDIDLALNQNWDKIEEFADMVNDKIIEIEDKDEEQDFNLQELQNEIKKDRENMINLEVEGQSIHIEDSSDLEGKLEVLGNVEQDVREGKNLYNAGKTIDDYFVTSGAKGNVITQYKAKDYVTCKIDKGVMIIEKYNTSGYNWVAKWIEIEKNTEYTISLDKSLTSVSVLGFSTKENKTEGVIIAELNASKKEANFNSGDYAFYAVSFYPKQGLEIAIQIEEGKQKTEFEQYGASPSPEFPSVIRAVGDNVNLLENTAKTQTVNGVTFTANEDGSIIANGIAEAEASLTINNQINLGKGEYCISGCPKGGGNNTYRIGLWNNTWESIALDLGDSSNFTLQQNTEAIKCAINIKQGTTVNNVVFKPKIKKGTIATSYSKFGQGSAEIKKQNKNLILTKPNQEVVTRGLTVETDVNGRITINGTAENTTYLKLYKEIVGTYLAEAEKWTKEKITKGNYRLSIQNIKGSYSTGNPNILMRNSPNAKTEINYYLESLNKDKSIKCPINKNMEVMWYMYIQKDATFNNFSFELLLEKTESNEYSNYLLGEERTYILPIQKPILEGDCFSRKDNKEVHTWKKIVLDGVNNKVTQTTTNLSGKYRYQYIDKDLKNCSLSEEKAYCTHLPLIEKSKTYDKILGFTVANNSIYIYTDGDTAVNFNAKLQNENYIFYIPVIESAYQNLDLTPEQIEILDELDNFQTYKPVTNITTDSIAKLKLKYIADTKTYIDNKTSNLEQQVNTINQLLSTTKTSSVLLDNLQTDIESEVL